MLSIMIDYGPIYYRYSWFRSDLPMPNVTSRSIAQSLLKPIPEAMNPYTLINKFNLLILLADGAVCYLIIKSITFQTVPTYNTLPQR